MMTSPTQNQFLSKNLMNNNLHVKFSVSMTFGLGVRLEGMFALLSHPPRKMHWSNSPSKIEFKKF